jgi:hypothetical protein
MRNPVPEIRDNKRSFLFLNISEGPQATPGNTSAGQPKGIIKKINPNVVASDKNLWSHHDLDRRRVQ